MNTKEKIVSTAIALFNKEGFMNSSMRRIAAECGITLSNLQYHFKTKELLMEAIYDEISTIFDGKADFDYDDASLRLLLDMNNMVFDFQKSYLFYFSEISTILRLHPNIRKKNLAIKNKRLNEYYKLFSAYAKAGYFKQEPYPDFFKTEAEKLWFLGNYYLLSQLSDGKKFSRKTFEEANKLSMNVIYSMLSDKGITEMLKLMGAKKT